MTDLMRSAISALRDSGDDDGHAPVGETRLRIRRSLDARKRSPPEGVATT